MPGKKQVISYYVDGKFVGTDKKKVPKDVKLYRTVHEEHYQSEAYERQQTINAHNYFQRQREYREDMEKFH